MKRFLVLVLGLVALGCGEKGGYIASGRSPKAVVEAAVTLELVEVGLDKICQVYESEQNGRAVCDMDGFSLIARLTNNEERVACTRYFINRLMSLKLEHLSYNRQADVFDFARRAVDGARVNLPRDDAGWEERYDLELKLLDWRKSHIERVKHKQPPEPRPGNLKDECELSGWRMIYYGGIEEYEASLRNMERLFPYAKRQMSEDAWNRIKSKIEAHLGRQMRTAAQIRADHKAKRHVEFTGK